MKNNTMPEENKQTQEDISIFNEVSEIIDPEIIAREEVERRYEGLLTDINARINEVRRLMKKRSWRNAVAFAKQLENVTKGEDKEKVMMLGFKAQTELNTALKKALTNAERERTRKNEQKAREYYHIALDLELDNRAARLALQEMDGLVKEKVSQVQFESLRAGLGDRRDIERLGNAIYDSEALVEEGKFPVALSNPLKEAREFYDKSRNEMGNETTAMRFGDIDARAYAVEKITDRIRRGDRKFYDETIGDFKSVYNVLEEARNLLRQASEDITQYEFNMAEKMKKTQPGYVCQRLKNVLGKPLDENMKRGLEEKIAEAEQYVELHEQAKKLQLRAINEPNSIKKLDMLLQAIQLFDNTLALKEQIAHTRPVALSIMQAGVNGALQQAGSFVDNYEYSDARTTIKEIDEQLAKWPEIKKPKEIVKLQNKVQIFRQKIDTKENDWKEYVRLKAVILDKIKDQSQRATGFMLFEQVSKDKRFKVFSDLPLFTSEVNQYQNIDYHDDLVDELKNVLKKIKSADDQFSNKIKEAEEKVKLLTIELKEIYICEDGGNATS